MKQKITMIIFVLLLGSILTSMLVVVDAYTAPMIAQNEKVKRQRSILAALEIPFEVDNVESVYNSKITLKKIGETEYFLSEQGNVGFQILGAGLWGPIVGIMAMNPDMATIKGITILAQEETPGLGSRIGEKDYLNTFVGKAVDPVFDIVAAGTAKAPNEVDGITGATLSCNAFEAIINGSAKTAITRYKEGAQ